MSRKALTANLPIPGGMVMGNLAEGALVVGQQVRRRTRVCARACAHSGCRRAGRRAGWPVYDEWIGWWVGRCTEYWVGWQTLLVRSQTQWIRNRTEELGPYTAPALNVWNEAAIHSSGGQSMCAPAGIPLDNHRAGRMERSGRRGKLGRSRPQRPRPCASWASPVPGKQEHAGCRMCARPG
jgi:hypothetical protein